MSIEPAVARRLVLTKQRLAGPRPSADASGIMKVMEDIGCIQIDPVTIVAPSHFLVLWSRISNYELEILDRLLWEDRVLFENWAHATSIVATSDYPIFYTMMKDYATEDSDSSERVRQWIEKNSELKKHILRELRERGPLSTSDFKDVAVEDWESSGWSASRNISRMLSFLWARGEIMVAGRRGSEKSWDLTQSFLPEWVDATSISWSELVYQAAQRSLKGLGLATADHIRQYFIRGCYPNLSDILTLLESEEKIVPIEIVEPEGEESWSGRWYVHSDDLSLLDEISVGRWDPRTTLLSPFDNLIADRRRTEQVFDFRYRFELYKPADQRTYGAYVMPILNNDRLVGRISPRMDRRESKLLIEGVYSEDNVAVTVEAGRAIAEAVEELAAFLGAQETVYVDGVPQNFRDAPV